MTISTLNTKIEKELSTLASLYTKLLQPKESLEKRLSHVETFKDSAETCIKHIQELCSANGFNLYNLAEWPMNDGMLCTNLNTALYMQNETYKTLNYLCQYRNSVMSLEPLSPESEYITPTEPILWANLNPAFLQSSDFVLVQLQHEFVAYNGYVPTV
jgi:hypothetical protein